MNGLDIISELRTFNNDGVDYCDHDRHLTNKDVERWSRACFMPRTQVFNEIAKCLAFGFYSSNLSFEFCDAVVNDLFGVITSSEEAIPQLFWKVYLAFDEGEYYRENKRDQNPVEIYTRPMIAQIVEAEDRWPSSH